MKRFIVLVVILSCAGCTTLQPIQGTSTELQQRVKSGELLKAGDRVSIVTTDAKTHSFAVREITAGLIVGRADKISVDQVVSLEKRQFSRAKTVALVVGVILVVGGGVAIL